MGLVFSKSAFMCSLIVFSALSPMLFPGCRFPDCPMAPGHLTWVFHDPAVESCNLKRPHLFGPGSEEHCAPPSFSPCHPWCPTSFCYQTCIPLCFLIRPPGTRLRSHYSMVPLLCVSLQVLLLPLPPAPDVPHANTPCYPHLLHPLVSLLALCSFSDQIARYISTAPPQPVPAIGSITLPLLIFILLDCFAFTQVSYQLNHIYPHILLLSSSSNLFCTLMVLNWALVTSLTSPTKPALSLLLRLAYLGTY